MGFNWSGPTTLWGLKDLSSFSMPFTEICNSGIWLYGLDWKGKLHPWSFSSWNFQWAKELKRYGDLGLKTDWTCLFRAFHFSQSSERVLSSDFSGATSLESCFECLSSEYIFLVFTWGGYFCLVQWWYLFLGYRLGNAHRPYLWPCEQDAYTLGISLCHLVCLTVSSVCTIYQAAYFLVYPWKAITTASFPCRDKFINVLLKSASKLIPQFLNICSSKVSEELRQKIPHSLFELVPVCFFVKEKCYVGPV